MSHNNVQLNDVYKGNKDCIWTSVYPYILNSVKSFCESDIIKSLVTNSCFPGWGLNKMDDMLEKTFINKFVGE